MKKSILRILISTICGISIADYRMSVPMEVANGGALQNGSITFTGSQNPVVETPAGTDECMAPSSGNYGWRSNKTTGAGSVIWNGTVIGAIAVGGTSVTGPSGIIYSKDESSTPLASGMFNLYGVCRNIPGNFNGGTWVSIAPIQSVWVNSGSAYKCTWTPDSSDYLPSQSVNQTGINCKQLQVSTSQEREQNDATLAIRNVGLPNNHNRDIDSDENPTRTVSGTDMTTEPETCLNVAYSSTSWVVDLSNNDNVNYISWMGNILTANEELGDITTFTYNGVTYKRGNYLNELSAGFPVVVYGHAYGVCRVNY